jgi:hypothetical protein
MAFRFCEFARSPHCPDSLFETFDSQRLTAEKFVLHGKARGSPADYAGFHGDDIAKGGRHKKVGAGLHHGNTRNRKAPQHFCLVVAEGVLKQRIGARIKVLEITRIKNDAERVAIAPFDLNLFFVGEHDSRSAAPLSSARKSLSQSAIGLHAIWFSGAALR